MPEIFEQETLQHKMGSAKITLNTEGYSQLKQEHGKSN